MAGQGNASPVISPGMDGVSRGGGGGGGGWVPVGARAVADSGNSPSMEEAVVGRGGGEAMAVDGEGALVPGFDARTAARMAEELFLEMAAGREAGR